MSLFQVDAISSNNENASENLVSLLQGLEVGAVPQVWIVGWDTTVVILPAHALGPLESVKV